MNIIDLDLDTIFQDCFVRSQGAVTECDCGREHVCIENPNYFDPIEDIDNIEHYWKRAEDPEELIVIHTDVDSIGLIEVGGQHFAEDCPCGGWKRYMDFILTHRREIRSFLIKVADKAQIALDQERTFNLLKDNKLNVLDRY